MNIMTTSIISIFALGTALQTIDGQHTLPKLPYDYAALEPYIDSNTMNIHHNNHHAAYVNNLNKALENKPVEGKEGVEAEFILDEGLSITKGIVPMINIPVASIGISEKGYMSVALTVEMDGGHSSYPEKETAITVLNEALHNIINKQMKAGISGPVKEFLSYTGPEMPFLPRAIFANQWLFKRLILKIYEGSNAGNASIRTTTAPTILKAGVKDNMVPTKAEAVVNFRIIPGETSDDVLKHLEKVMSDNRVKINVLGNIEEPSPVSPINSSSFEIIHTTIKQVFPEVMVNPMMALGATDSRHYVAVSKNIYKFIPVLLAQEDLARIHGLNERISIEDFTKAMGFYYQLIKNLD